MRLSLSLCIAVVLASCAGMVTGAQGQDSTFDTGVDVGVLYQGTRWQHAPSNTGFWTQGGALEMQVRLLHRLCAVAQMSGYHASEQTTGGTPLSGINVLFGPRYSVPIRQSASIFGEVLGGEANAFNSNFPGGSGPVDTPGNGRLSSAKSGAFQFGGGVDISNHSRITIRALQIDWVRINFPNGGTDHQNNLSVGAGIVVRLFGRPQGLQVVDRDQRKRSGI